MLTGVIVDSNKACKRLVSVDPIAAHYEEKGEPPYIKYRCPVCRALGNKVSIPHGVESCPLCGVHLNWDRKPEKGDLVIITNSRYSQFPKDTECTVAEVKENDLSAGECMTYYLKHNKREFVKGFARDEFTILNETDD